jgi:DNA repair protein RadD
MQIVGRGMRPAEGKNDCFVRDFGDNIKRHGPIDCIEVRRKEDVEKVEVGQMPYKICQNCGVTAHTRLLFCKVCGTEFPLSKAIQIKAAKESILSEPEEHDIVNFVWLRGEKEGKPPSFRLKMKIGEYDTINLFMLFEHGGFMAHRARKLWKEAFDCDRFEAVNPGADHYPVPSTVQQAMELVQYLKRPLKVRAIKKGKYYEVLGIVYQDTAKHVAEMDELSELTGLNI